MRVSFVIPCYNEEGNAVRIYESIHETFKETGAEIECIMVNDGSKDRTGEVLSRLYAEKRDKLLTVVRFSRNFGKEAAILCGLKRSSGDYVCVIDADMQQHPRYALQMYEMLASDEDLDAVGAYQDKRKESALLKFCKKCFYALVNKLSETHFRPAASDFRMMKRRMVDAVLEMTEYYRFSKGIFSWVGFQTAYIPYRVALRESGVSSWSFFKLFRYAVEGIVGYTTAPLVFPAYFGAGLSVLSFILLIVFIVIKASGVPLPDMAFILSVLCLLFGLLFIMIGIVGVYLAKTYMQGKNRPVYIEKSVLNGREDGGK